MGNQRAEILSVKLCREVCIKESKDIALEVCYASN